MEPSDDVFRKSHRYLLDEQMTEGGGENEPIVDHLPHHRLALPQLDESSSSSSENTERWSNRLSYSITGNKRATNETVHSVFLATGLFLDADQHMHQVPTRHSGTIKASLRWFVELCAAGIGMMYHGRKESLLWGPFFFLVSED